MSLAVWATDLPAVHAEGKGKVDIVAWPGYIERGENDRNCDQVTGFVDRAREKKYIEGVSGNGFVHEPTLLAGARQDDEIVCRESSGR